MLKKRVNSFVAKVNDYESFVQVDGTDTNLLSKMIDQGFKKLKVSFFQALFNISLCCRKNRKMKI